MCVIAHPHSLTHSLSLACMLAHLLICSLTHSLTHHPLTHSLTHSPTHSLTLVATCAASSPRSARPVWLAVGSCSTSSGSCRSTSMAASISLPLPPLLSPSSVVWLPLSLRFIPWVSFSLRECAAAYRTQCCCNVLHMYTHRQAWS